MIAVPWAHGKAVHNSRTGDGNKICKLAAMKQNENKEWQGSSFLFHLPVELLVTITSALTQSCGNKGSEQQPLSVTARDETQRWQEHWGDQV